MSIAFSFLIVLIAVAPLVALLDGPFFDSLITAMVAATLAIIAVAMPPGEARHQLKSTRLILILLAIPALWMVSQAIPIPFRTLANPVWLSAGSALGRSLTGSVTVDIGRTVITLIHYLTALGLIFASSALCINRDRAEKTLAWLTGATTAMSLLLIGGPFLGLTSYPVRESLQGASAVGIVISAAAILRSFGRHKARDKTLTASPLKIAWAEAAYVVAHVICWIAVVKFTSTQVTVAAGYGLAIVVVIVFGRSFGTGRWAIITFAGLALATILGLAATRFAGEGDLTIRYSSASLADILVAGRIRADTGWQGSGAGTFTALLPIYQDVDGAARFVPTTAADLGIELGTPALALFVVFVLTGSWLLLRGALSRGRDSYYPALAASSAVVALIEAFVDASAIQTSVVIITAIIAGLGFAQIASRTTANSSP